MKRYLIIICSICVFVNTVAQDKEALAKSDSLFAKGVELYNLHKYKEAIPLFTESDRIDKAELDSTSNRRDYSAMWLASCYYLSGDTVKAREFSPAYYFVKPIDRRLTIESDSLSNLGIDFYQKGELTKASKYLVACSDLERDVIGEKSIWFGNTLMYIGEIYVKLGLIENAITTLNQYLEIVKYNYGDTSATTINELITVSQIYSSLDERQLIELALKPALEAYDISVNTRQTKWITTSAFILFLNYYRLAQYINFKENLTRATIYLKDFYSSGNETFQSRYYECCEQIIDAYYNEAENKYQNDPYNSIEYIKEAICLHLDIFGNNKLSYISLLDCVAKYYGKIEDYENSISARKESINIIEQYFGVDNQFYCQELRLLALDYLLSRQLENAISVGLDAVKIWNNNKFNTHDEKYLNNLQLLMYAYRDKGDIIESLKFGKDLLNGYKETNGEYCEEIIPILADLAELNFYLGNFEDAMNYNLESLRIIERFEGHENIEYIKALNRLSVTYLNFCRFQDAISTANRAAEIAEKFWGESSQEYIDVLGNLGSSYSGICDYNTALKFYDKAINLANHLTNNEKQKVVLLSNKAKCYHEMGDDPSAIRFGTEALDIMKKLTDGDNMNAYATLINNIAIYTAGMGDYINALRLCTESLEISEAIFGKKSPNNISFISNMALFNSFLGNWNKAQELLQQALTICRENYGTDNYDYAFLMTNIADCYYAQNNFKKAIQLNEEALIIFEHSVGKNHLSYASCLSNLSKYYSANLNNIKAYSYLTEAKQTFKNILGEQSTQYAICLARTATVTQENRFSEVIENLLTALDILRKNLGYNHPNYIEPLTFLCHTYFKSNEVNKLENSIDETNKLLTALVKSSFLGLTLAERKEAWTKWRIWFEEDVNKFAMKYNSISNISNGLNATILSKGVLLDSEREFSSLVSKSKNEEVISLYNDFRATKRLLEKIYENPKFRNANNVDSLNLKLEKLEIQLLDKSKELGDFTRNMSITWKEIKEKLNPQDLAIEFISFINDENIKVYAAYIISAKPNDFPKMIYLFKEDELKKILSADIYSNCNLSNLIWSKFDSYFDGVSRVFFAPTGELYNIAIESLPHYNNNSELMSDKYMIFRLSSTRELAIRKRNYLYSQIALYGGMKYDTNTSFLQKDMDKYPQLYNRDLAIDLDADFTNLRDGVAELPETSVEVDNIELLLSKALKKPLVYKGLDGTEASFKALSGKDVRSVHLATHGFYWTESEVRRTKEVSFLKQGNNYPEYVEDKALLRSGLLFSGANNVLRGNVIPPGVEDGVLTAKEISVLDLSALDLVVLSACQTGLGDITGDGVFGLQRGFKKAGVKSLLMSLWKVGDRATQMLMTKFYEHFLSGKSKLESLTLAQQYVREFEEEVEMAEDTNMTASQKRRNKLQGDEVGVVASEKVKVKPFADPKYWAAFILLDALD